MNIKRKKKGIETTKILHVDYVGVVYKNPQVLINAVTKTHGTDVFVGFFLTTIIFIANNKMHE